jgi:hypothetical protein
MKERMRFDAKLTPNGPAYGVDLDSGNGCEAARKCHEAMHSRYRENRGTLLNMTLPDHIAGEQGQSEMLSAILPMACDSIKRQKDFESISL